MVERPFHRLRYVSAIRQPDGQLAVFLPGTEFLTLMADWSEIGQYVEDRNREYEEERLRCLEYRRRMEEGRQSIKSIPELKL